jgi:hypothetical protein
MRSALLLTLALTAVAGAAPRGTNVRQVGVLRFVGVPDQLRPSWSRSGLDRRSFDPDTMLGHLRAVPGLGPTILSAVDGGGYSQILVVFQDGGWMDRGAKRELKALGISRRKSREDHDTMATWTDYGGRGLIRILVDKIVRKRRRGFAHTPASSLAHELVHVAQGTWGSLGRAGDPGHFNDVQDEAEAFLVARQVEFLEARAKGGILNEGETNLLRAPPRSNRASLAALLQRLAKGPYHKLGAGSLRVPGRYDPRRDPFARLP